MPRDRQGSAYGDNMALLLQYKGYLFILLVIFSALMIRSTWAWVALGAVFLICLFRLNRRFMVNITLNQISNGMAHMCNYFQEPRWGLTVRKNRSGRRLVIEFVYEDRFLWEENEFSVGPVFYAKFHHDPFDATIFKKLRDYCSEENIGFESSGGSYVLGKKKEQDSKAISFRLLVDIMKIYFADEDLQFYYSCRFKDPIRDKEPGRQLIDKFRSSEKLNHHINPIEPDFFESIRGSATW